MLMATLMHFFQFPVQKTDMKLFLAFRTKMAFYVNRENFEKKTLY